MKKVLLVTNYGSFDSAYSFWEQGIYPSNHLWGKIELEKQYNYKVDILPDLKSYKRIRKIGDLFKIAFLDRQIQMCLNAHKYDIVYTPFLNLVVLINLCKVFRLVRVPVLCICHTRLRRDKSSFLKRIKGGIGKLKYVAIDKILFLGEKLYQESLDYGIARDRIGWINWGIDIAYYDKIRNKSTKLPRYANNFVSTGKTFRDFDTVVKAFSKVPDKLAIFLPDNYSLPLSPNVQSLAEISVSYNSTLEMAEIIANGRALLIPLVQTDSFWGLTSLLEAIALGKPTISTKNEYFYFDIEAEKVGLWVEKYDVDGWVKSVELLSANEAMLAEFELHALELRKKYSMDQFADRLHKTFLAIIKK
ncbi:glycosyltransferase family protein [Filimonas effusa]|uniref:Glycosyltransferase n=1 Tax=Filimonas effusa TaxID=2508721 RepID=A0A4Q1DF75_9BACT|nr:glycosyltransferase family 4 protein [Filimonas effusa]RXK87353.1 hypothetical protein ESB13_11410 [Filimonas effusa]